MLKLDLTITTLLHQARLLVSQSAIAWQMEFGRGESWLPEILVTVAVERVFTLYMM